MNLVNYEPWSLWHRFHNNTGRFYDDVGSRAEPRRRHWSPAVDIKEEDDRFVLHADVPGVEAKDIEVTAQDGVLVISAERSHDSSENQDGFQLVERQRGTFLRRFKLPDTTSSEKIEAKYENGVLTVSIPKQEKAQPRRIAVS